MICSVIVNDRVIIARRNESPKENPIKTRNAFRCRHETSWKKTLVAISCNSYGEMSTVYTQLPNLNHLSIFILKIVTRKNESEQIIRKCSMYVHVYKNCPSVLKNFWKICTTVQTIRELVLELIENLLSNNNCLKKLSKFV